MKQKVFILFMYMVAAWYGAMAQADIVASGGGGIGSTGAVSYSVGQMAYRQYSGAGGNVSEGVQQAYEVTELGLENSLDVFDCLVYPNPTFSGVRFIMKDSSFPEMHAELHDINGKSVLSLPILSKEHDIRMEQLTTGTYILRLYSAKKLVKSFKIIKY